MVALLNDSAARERMGQCALEVARRMSVATHVERLESILRDATSARAASATAMTHWTILTCEYPPGCGGVGDYTAQVAAALAEAGDTVTVFCPPRAVPAPRDLGDFVEPPGVEVVMLDDVYGSIGRRTIDQRLGDQRLGRGPSTILVQYVPTGFGLRGANIPWCRWLLERRRRHGDDVRVMFHEPYFEFTWSPIRQNALAVAERLMARMLLRAASRVYLSTDAWRRYLAPHTAGGRSAGLRHVADSIGDSALRSTGRRRRTPQAAPRIVGAPARRPFRHVRVRSGADAHRGPDEPDGTRSRDSRGLRRFRQRRLCSVAGRCRAHPSRSGHRNRASIGSRRGRWSSVRVTCSCNPTRTASRQDGHRSWRGWSTPARSSRRPVI